MRMECLDGSRSGFESSNVQLSVSMSVDRGKREKAERLADKTGIRYEPGQNWTERAEDGPLVQCLPTLNPSSHSVAVRSPESGAVQEGAKCSADLVLLLPVVNRDCRLFPIDQSDDQVTPDDGCPDLQTTTNPRKRTVCMAGKSGRHAHVVFEKGK